MNKNNYLIVIYNIWKYDKIITTEYYYREEKNIELTIDHEYTNNIKKKITKKLMSNYVDKPKFSFLNEFDSPKEIYIEICEIKFESVYHISELLNYLNYMQKFYKIQKNYYQNILHTKIYDFSEMKDELIKIEKECSNEYSDLIKTDNDFSDNKLMNID